MLHNFLFLQPYNPCWEAVILTFYSIVHDGDKAVNTAKNSRESECLLISCFCQAQNI